MVESLFEIVHEPIQIETIVNKVKRSEAGAITTFIGTVREWTNEKKNCLFRIPCLYTNGRKNAL